MIDELAVSIHLHHECLASVPSQCKLTAITKVSGRHPTLVIAVNVHCEGAEDDQSESQKSVWA